ncbi:hypothetical protein [Amycolatopsis sp. NPDC051372]|uniref:hypothetical protein n=1 Tax=Amycolatopsis sp. NPDC051372 TaxID=3155669 RepID=UPI0034298C2D
MDSDRERLAELLSVAPGEIAASAREALVTGATFKLWPGASTASQFRSVFRRRQRNAFRVGRPSIGFAEGFATSAPTKACSSPWVTSMTGRKWGTSSSCS